VRNKDAALPRRNGQNVGIGQSPHSGLH
jgi:hypothetical protein